jgi:hypothetical protein
MHYCIFWFSFYMSRQIGVLDLHSYIIWIWKRTSTVFLGKSYKRNKELRLLNVILLLSRETVPTPAEGIRFGNNCNTKCIFPELYTIARTFLYFSFVVLVNGSTFFSDVGVSVPKRRCITRLRNNHLGLGKTRSRSQTIADMGKHFF